MKDRTRSLQVQTRSAKKELEEKNVYLGVLAKIYKEVLKHKNELENFNGRKEKPKKLQILKVEPSGASIDEKFKKLVSRLPERQKVDLYEIKDMNLNKRNIHFLQENIDFLMNNAKTAKAKIDELDDTVIALKEEKKEYTNQLDKLLSICYMYKKKINREKSFQVSNDKRSSKSLKITNTEKLRKNNMLYPGHMRGKSIFSTAFSNSTPYGKDKSTSSENKQFNTLMSNHTSQLLFNKLAVTGKLVLDKKKLLMKKIKYKTSAQKERDQSHLKQDFNSLSGRIIRTEPDRRVSSLPKIYDFKNNRKQDNGLKKIRSIEKVGESERKVSFTELKSHLKGKVSIDLSNKNRF